jgi:hypothetical protein
MCILDFYVHESVQRGGVGKVYFKIYIYIHINMYLFNII